LKACNLSTLQNTAGVINIADILS